MSRPVPERAGIQTLVGSSETSMPSLPRVDESRATILPAPSFSCHHPIRSSNRLGGTQLPLPLRIPPSGHGSTTVSVFCPQPHASIASARATAAVRLEGRKQPSVREQREAIDGRHLGV